MVFGIRIHVHFCALFFQILGYINPFSPEDLKWTLSSCMANSVDPDEMAHDEPSHLDLHCLQWYLFWSAV